MVENNLGIIVGSIPALAPLFRSVLDKTSNISSRQRHNGTPSPYSLRNFYKRKESRTAASGNHSTVNAQRPGGGKNNAAEDPWRTEGGSDEHLNTLNNAGSIYTRTEFSVEHEPRDEGGGNQ